MPSSNAIAGLGIGLGTSAGAEIVDPIAGITFGTFGIRTVSYAIWRERYAVTDSDSDDDVATDGGKVREQLDELAAASEGGESA